MTTQPDTWPTSQPDQRRPPTTPLHIDTQNPPAYRIPTIGVFALMVISCGLYLFIWFYQTWAQYRDHTGEEAHPLGHTLSLLIPIYSFYKFGQHCFAFKNLADSKGARNNMNMQAIFVIFMSSVLTGIIARTIPMPVDTPLLIPVALLAPTPIAAIPICWTQFNINRYWTHISKETIRTAKFGIPETLSIVPGLLLLAYLASQGA